MPSTRARIDEVWERECDDMAVIESSAIELADQAVPRLDLRAKALYGVGEVANSVRMVLFGLFTLFFYTTVMGLPGTLVGIVSAIGLVWDAVIDPYIGHASDRLRLRFGRRHTLMLAGTMFMWLTLWMLFSPPRGLPTGALFAWFLASNLLVRLASSVFTVPYYALGAELSGDYHERTNLTGVRGAIGLLGALAAGSLAFVLFFPSSVTGEDPKLNYAGYPAMGLTFGVVMSLAALVAVVATLPWRPYLPGAATSGRGISQSVVPDSVSALRNASFRTLFLSYSLIFLGTAISSALSIYFFTYHVEIVDGRALGALQLALYGGALVGVPIWLRIAKGVEKRQLYLVAAIALAFLLLGGFVLLGQGRPLGTGDVRLVLVAQALVGLAVSLFWVLPWSMLADVTDEDALTAGQHREGLFFGIFSFGQQLATGLSVLVVGVLLDRFAGLVPGRVPESRLTIERIAMLSSLLPASLVLIAALVILRYPLNRRRVAAIQARLARDAP